jgi:hypothetical protein
MDIYYWDAGLAATGKYVTLDKTFYNLLFKQEVIAAQLLPHFLS